ncbi:CocE/NonD family hydrolase [Allosalinactinospora lopnorensis]|uniref:CocE/NonD family hydrolase n=1 Tax=Allosalinactinospora lopnorensis TaxID=1352348 RepID=UPI000696E304
MGGPLAQNHLESRRDVLSYTSPALEEPVDIAGPVRLCLWVDSTAPDTDFVGKLLDVRPDGRAIIIADGALRVRHREGFDTEKPLHPREAAEIVVDLGHVCARIATGHRIRVHISSSNFPHLDRNANSGAPVGTDETLSTARQRVHHKGARASGLTLTVLSGD